MRQEKAAVETGDGSFTVRYGRTASQLVCGAELRADGKSVTVPALFDTGSERTVISEGAARALGLGKTGGDRADTMFGHEDMPGRVVDISLPGGIGFEAVSVFSTPGIEACRVPVPGDEDAGERPLGAIIGMDLIGRGRLSAGRDGDGTVLSFACPGDGAGTRREVAP